jgi:hypothetical protein
MLRKSNELSLTIKHFMHVAHVKNSRNYYKEYKDANSNMLQLYIGKLVLLKT